MKKTIIAAIIAAASMSVMAGASISVVEVKDEIVGKPVQASKVELGSRTKAEFEHMAPVDLTLRVVDPKIGEKYAICPVFNLKTRLGADAVDIAVGAHKDGGVKASLYREDGKTPLTPEQCWPIENANEPVTAKVVIKPIGSYFGEIHMFDVGFVAMPLVVR